MSFNVMTLLSAVSALAQGFSFGTGYGSGVRFGFEDVYPFLKQNLGEIGKILGLPFAGSGFKSASGVNQPMGFNTPK